MSLLILKSGGIMHEGRRFRQEGSGTIPFGPRDPFMFVFTDKLSSDPKRRPAASR